MASSPRQFEPPARRSPTTCVPFRRRRVCWRSSSSAFRYEEIIGNEARVFGELFGFYGLSSLERALGSWFAKRYSLGRLAGDVHVRNPEAGQWRKYFTPRVQRAFDADHPVLVERLGYPAE